jgi:hypothetical protein
MEMLLMGACLSMFGLAVACLAFGAATRETGEMQAAVAPAIQKEAVQAAASPARFFVNPPVLPLAARTPVPIEALLLEIENHVRLEQAAAECFVAAPNAARLHSRTTSALLN